MVNFNIIFAFVAIFAAFSAGQQCTEKGMQKFDANMARLITIANSGRSFPSDRGESLKKWCAENVQLIGNLESYKAKCFKDLAKQTFGVLIYAVKNSFGQFCKKESKTLDDMLSAVPCMEKNNHVITKCYTNLIDGILGAKNALDKNKIPHLCCEYAQVLKCFNEKLTRLPRCNEKNVEAVSNLIRGIMGNIIGLVCGDYVEGSDKCEHLGPAPKKKKSQKRTKSFAIPALELLSSFPSV